MDNIHILTSVLYIIVCIVDLLILTTYPKAKAINEITCSLYPCGFLFGTKIIIASILVLFDFIQSYHSCSYKYWFTHHIKCSSWHNLSKNVC